MAVSINGVQPEQALWLAPVSQVNDPNVKWTPFVAREDDVTAVAAVGDTLYLLSHKNAPTFQVLSVEAGRPLSDARVLVPGEKNRVLDAIHAASDALYVLARQGAYSRLLRVPHAAGKIEEVTLPFKGLIREAFTDPRQPGITINLQSFVVPPTTFAYDPAKKNFTDLKLAVTATYDSGRYEVSDLEARAQDDVMVPNALVRPKGAKGPQIVLIQAYGWYGISQLANFSFRALSFLEAGGTYASCHVRGGGELGEAWRLAGKDANKPNTWRDLIACAEDLIARGYTTKDKLFILGGSGGGITVGRAMTERPDLFAGVIAVVPGANALRWEFQPAGPLNIPESGTIRTEEGFKNLYEMDTIRHVRPDVQYPPVLITTGLNDPRAAPWEPAQLAAALQASGTARPILLRVDEQAGHGIGSTKSQDDALYADMWAFVFWRAGLPDWRPRFSATGDAHAEAGIEDDALLDLPWKQFDQTLGSGWHVYAMREEHLLAARLIERYLARRSDLTPVQRAISHFHAGAELARVNLLEEALLHFDQAIVPADSKGVPEDYTREAWFFRFDADLPADFVTFVCTFHGAPPDLTLP